MKKKSVKPAKKMSKNTDGFEMPFMPKSSKKSLNKGKKSKAPMFNDM